MVSDAENSTNIFFRFVRKMVQQSVEVGNEIKLVIEKFEISLFLKMCVCVRFGRLSFCEWQEKNSLLLCSGLSRHGGYVCCFE